MKGFITSLRITSLKDQGLLSSSEILNNGHTITTGFPDLSMTLLQVFSPMFIPVIRKIMLYSIRILMNILWILPSNSENQCWNYNCIKPRKYIIWIRL